MWIAPGRAPCSYSSGSRTSSTTAPRRRDLVLGSGELVAGKPTESVRFRRWTTSAGRSLELADQTSAKRHLRRLAADHGTSPVARAAPGVRARRGRGARRWAPRSTPARPAGSATPRGAPRDREVVLERRCLLGQRVRGPQPVGAAEVGDARIGGDAGAGEHGRVGRRGHGVQIRSRTSATRSRTPPRAPGDGASGTTAVPDGPPPVNPCAAGESGSLGETEAPADDATPIEVTATEFEFDGLDTIDGTGQYALTLTNEGNELHEVVLVRIDDDETRPIEELLQETDPSSFATDIAFAFACPGASSEPTAVDIGRARPVRRRVLHPDRRRSRYPARGVRDARPSARDAGHGRRDPGGLTPRFAACFPQRLRTRTSM
jgi:hypothetical protein